MEAATATAIAEPRKRPAERPWWRDTLAPYTRPRVSRSILDLATSVVPYVALFALAYMALDVSYLLVLALAVPAAGFLLRTYILFHDCTHGSFMPTKRGNTWLGVGLGLLVYSTYHAWRHDHAIHHATAGDLDRRGKGDVPVLTVAEYRAMGRRGRIGYRLFRNQFVMFGLGPLWALVINPRLTKADMRPRIKRSVHLTNVAVVLAVTAACLLLGWKEFLLVQAPIAWLAGSAGVFMFYVQHQFEDVYWERGGDWSYADAALQGSSYLRLPRVLQFFTGNIGFHHIHHLSARIPNYNLPRAHNENPKFQDVPTLSLWDGLRSTRLKLYDEDRGRMVTWRELRRTPAVT